MTGSSPTDAEVERQKQHILRGAVDVISEPELERKLARSIRENRPLRVKLGVDPTSSDLHLGFTVPLGKLRAFQELGHQAVLIIGDATAMVGDPTARNKARPRLGHGAVLEFARDYLEQARKVIDIDKAEIRHNSEWLHQLDFQGFIALASRATVAQMLERDDFSKRHQERLPIYIHEFLYPLLQGYDSVAVKADVELGGTDQLFNLLVGRDLQVQEGQEPQVCLTTPLLVGLDGQLKMSKSYGNAIGITEPSDSMFASVMRIDDALMRSWFVLLTTESQDDIDALLEGGANPRDIKLRLGHSLCARYHGEKAASAAQERWEKVVSRGEIPDDIGEISVPAASGGQDGWSVVDLLMLAFPSLKSRGEARRLMKGGGVTINAEKIEDPLATIQLQGGEVLRAGRKNISRLMLGDP
jgi:tyrosyl-tRNA synthetase